MMHKLVTFIDADLYERVKARAGDVPIARYLRRLIREDVEQPALGSEHDKDH